MADNDDKIKISELNPALTLDNTSETVVNKQVSGSWVTFKMTIATLAAHILEAFSSSAFKTNNKTVVGAVNQTISNLAPDFNTTAGSTYAKDDCVLYNGNLKQCINPNGTTSGTFIDADWTDIKAVDVGSGGGGGGSSTLAGLNDVNLSSLSNNQVLKYNATSHKWENGAGGGSSGDHITLTQAEYDALVQEGTVDPNAFYFIKDTNGDGQNFQPVIYSLEEREIGVWTDGKPLYEKTIINSNPTYVKVGNVYEVTTAVSFSGVDEIVHLIPMALASTSSRTFGARTDLGVFEYCACNLSNNLIYTALSSNNYSKLIFAIRYTKTTDVAGSGTWTPQGVPAVHYSTDEHVVGTWVDGSTLYEKTINFGALPDSSEKSVAHNISNVDKIWISDGFVFTSSNTFYGLVHTAGSSQNMQFAWDTNVNRTNVTMETYSDRSTLSAYVIVRYTKTST